MRRRRGRRHLKDDVSEGTDAGKMALELFDARVGEGGEVGFEEGESSMTALNLLDVGRRAKEPRAEERRSRFRFARVRQEEKTVAVLMN